MSAPTSVPVQYHTEDGADVTNLSVAMGKPASVPCGRTFADIISTKTSYATLLPLIGNRLYCEDCAKLLTSQRAGQITVFTTYPVEDLHSFGCGDAIALPKPTNWTGTGYTGYGANVARLTAAARYCARQGDGYLPPSKQGTEDEPTSFFRQRLGINDNLIRDHAPTTPEPRTPARKPTPPPTPPIAQSVTQPAIDWETQYHMAEANYILVKSENDRLRQRLTDLGFTVTGKPGLAQVSR